MSLDSIWARTGVPTLLLSPLALLFLGAATLRRAAYRRGWRASYRVGVPVIVVGNITAGGSGKTPLVIWLVEWLRARGLRPGVVSRGYGGSARGCVDVRPDSPASVVGDEPLLIRVRGGAPVVVGRDRVAAARALMAWHAVDIIVADDGLQHYRLQRDIEIAVVDAAAGLGNRWPLPAGPLREPPRRLESVDAVVEVVRNGAPRRADIPAPAWLVNYGFGRAYRLAAPGQVCAPRELPGRDWLAVSGIARPEGFFDMLRAQGIRFVPRAFPDHHAFVAQDIPVDAPVLMTEKDAIKCGGFAGADWWAVTLDVMPESGFLDWLGTRIEQLY